MATFTVGPNQAARFDLFDIGALDGNFVYASTPNVWRVGASKADSGTNTEFLGTGFTYSAGALTAGTIQSITTHIAGPIGFQIAGISLSASSFNTYLDAGDSQGFLGKVFSGADTMTGGDLGDALYGFAGDDHLEGLGGNDVLDGGTGADTLEGGLGNDLYIIDNVGDVVVEYGKNTGDRISANISIDLTKAAYDGVEDVTLTGGASLNATGDGLANFLKGNLGANTLSGGAGNDTLSGLGGNDVLDGGSGIDTLKGGDGNDTYYVDVSEDVVSEVDGAKIGGTDIVYSSADYFTLPVYVENLTLTVAESWGVGNSAANTLKGTAGTDFLDGKGGADILIGGAGNDQYYVDSTKDTVTESSTGGIHDLVISSAGTYTLPSYVEWLYLASGSADIDAVGNSVENHMSGNDGDNTLDGAGGVDVLSGGAGNDTLIGGAGNDFLTGGPGVNQLDTGLGNDTASYWGGLDVIQGFDGNATGGQDKFDLASYFFKLGVAEADRADRVHVSDQGATVNVWLDYDGDGSFDFQVAEIHTVDVIQVGEDITVNF